MTSIAGLPDFLLYLGTGAVLTGLYLAVYTLATAHNEVALIRRDVTAASVSLGGSLVGFTLPLAVAIYNAASVLDCLVWGLVALVVQIASLTDVYWPMSGDVVLMTLVGGLGTIFGPIVGAFAILSMQYKLAWMGQWVLVIQGVIFVICVLLFRRGIVGEIAHRLRIKL